MRTTLTLDDDVSAGIERIRTAQGKPLKTVINDALRRGLADLMQVREPRVEYRTRPLKTGRCRLPNLDDVSEALDVAEGDKRP